MGSTVGETYLKRLIVFYIPLFLFVFAMVFPFFWMFITSIKPDPELYNPRLSPFLVREPTLTHWKTLLADTLFVDWAINTLWVAIASTAISLFAGVLAGYALARLIFPGSTIIGISIFVTYLVPPTLLFIPLTGVVSWMGLQDTTWSLIFTYPTFLVPFCTWLLMGYFQTIPRELEGCARIDGATRIQPTVFIILPLDMPRRLSRGGTARRRGAHSGDGFHHSAARVPRHPVRRHLRLPPVVAPVPLRARVRPLAGEPVRSGRRHLRADRGRRVLLGLAH